MPCATLRRDPPFAAPQRRQARPSASHASAWPQALGRARAAPAAVAPDETFLPQAAAHDEKKPEAAGPDEEDLGAAHGDAIECVNNKERV